MERALCRRAVAEERHRHAPVGSQLGGRGGAHGDRQTRGHDAVRTEDPDPGVCDVHGATATAVRPLVLAHQLGEHPGRIQALGEAVSVSTVGRRDHIGRAQRPAGADRSRLLPDGEMHESRHLAVPIQVGNPLFEAANHQHAALHLNEVTHRELGGWERVDGHQVCIVLVGTTKESHDRPDPDPRDVPGTRRGLGEAGRDHRRQQGPRGAARACVLPCRSVRGARRTNGAGPEGGRRRAARPIPRAQR